jgi:nucleotide-binding universal stress UspA family protein
MKLSGPVLAAISLDKKGDEVIRQAADHAENARVPLIVIHVIPEIYGTRPLFPHLREIDQSLAETVRQWVMEAIDQQLRRVLPGNTEARELRIEAGSIDSTVIKVADEVEAGLVVVGAASERDRSLGNVAERIVRHARCPVLVARVGAGNVVIAATDFSDPALPAIEAGHEEARRRGQRLILMHAVDVRILHVPSPLGSQSSLLQHVIDAEMEQARLKFDRVVDRYGPGVTSIVRVGAPADAILEAAREFDASVIVMGTHGRSGLIRITLGGVAESVVRGASRSVLVVRLAS